MTTEVTSPSNETVQTRYSFYNASSSDQHPHNHQHQSFSRSRSKQSQSSSTTSTTQTKPSSHSHSHSQSMNPTITLSASASSEGLSPSGSAMLGIPMASSTKSEDDGVEGILRSLRETEDLGLHKNVRGTESESASAGSEGGNGGNGGRLNNLPSLDAFDPFEEQEDSNSNSPDQVLSARKQRKSVYENEARSQAQAQAQADYDDDDDDQSQSSFFYETAVKDVLSYIRLRSQKRNALYQHQHYKQPLPLVAETEDLSHSNATATDTYAMLSANEEEWKLRRGQMAQVASNSMNMASANANSNVLPLPLHPSSAGASASGSVSVSGNNNTSALTLATKLEDRLLSPPADVRKTVELSAAEMFRLQNNHNIDHSNAAASNATGSVNINANHAASNSNNDGKNLMATLTSSVKGLELANSIHSLQSNHTHAGESPMQKIVIGGGGMGNKPNPNSKPSSSSHPPFSVVPSSPAPGKFHLLNSSLANVNYNSNANTNTTVGSTAASASAISSTITNNPNSNINSSNPNAEHLMQQRQTELELERRWRREEEIERGVEQVLMAILQSASTTNTPTNKTSTYTNQTQNSTSTSTQDKKKDGSSGIAQELIENVFSSLLNSSDASCLNGGSTTTATGGKMRIVRVPSEDVVDGHAHDPNGNNTHSEMMMMQGVTHPTSGNHWTSTTANNIVTTTPSKACSIVDELLAEAETPDTEINTELIQNNNHVTGVEVNMSTNANAPTPQAPSEAMEIIETMQRIEKRATKSLYHGHATNSKKNKHNTSIHPYTVEADGTLEVEVERDSRQSVTPERFDGNEEDMEEEEDVDSDGGKKGMRREQVLGPLSKVSGGTTGVVLDDSKTDDEDVKSDKRKSTSRPVPKKTNSNKIFDTITAVVRRGGSSGSGGEKKNCRGSEKVHSDEIVLPRKSTMPQIKELYAHMLPYQSNKTCRKSVSYSNWFTEKLSGTFNKSPPKHPWDEQDPDELGYIIHIFSRLQLQMIEQDYEDVMDKINRKYDLAVKKGIVKAPPKKKLERDPKSSPLKRKNSNGKIRPSSSDPPMKPRPEENRVGMNKRKLSFNRLATNPNFPNAKPAGSGEVGELEIYHLPIIYKAHQTGFEPTKDLVLQPDTVFAGNYYVQGELGSAAFSTAYRCVDLNSGKKGDDGETYYDEVCLKVIKNTKDFFDQSLDEIKILELLRQTNQCHENNILEMKTFFYHKEHLIIVTELLRQNLFEFGKYITDNDEPQYFTRIRLCHICRQCLVALSFVHKLGLVHSDIKPENILLASYSRARVKVIDFGSSCYLTDRQSSYIQSRSYRAPEVILGLPYSGKIDIWSLGCVIAEMYTGQVTFQNDSVVTMLSRIEAICGAFPRHMVENGRQSGQFFTPTGLLYEKAELDDDSEARLNTTPNAFDDDSLDGDNELFNVFQPKITTMAARLGLDPNLMEKKRTNWEDEEKALFVDFVSKVLTIDPDKRPTADEALSHPWILSGYNVNEEDLKYPPEE